MLKAPEKAVGRVTWCGPYAIAAVLPRWSYTTALNALKARRGGAWERVMGVPEGELVAIINSTGKRHARIIDSFGGKRSPKPTLTQWYRQRPDRQATYIVVAGDHYLTIAGTKIIDNWTCEWQPFHMRKKHKKARVRCVIKVMPK